ncbi:MAG: alpha/beta hydrolase [Chloroflexia bacterium]
MPQSKLNIRERGKAKGEGTPLVLVHGFPFDGSMWEKQLDGLGDELWVVAPDMPGMGESDPLALDREANMDDYADAIADWAKSEGIENLVLAGHSMGGYIAFAFARKYPEMLEKLILIATRPGADADAAREGRYKTAGGVEEKGAVVAADAMFPKLFAPSTYEKDKETTENIRSLMLRQRKRGVIDSLHAMAGRPDSSPDMPRIKAPTLIISGLQDAIIPGSEAEGMHNSITGSRHIAIENAGHLPMLEDARAFNKALREFLEA